MKPMLTIKMRNDRKKITQTFIVERFRLEIDKITLANAFSLKSHITYGVLVFNRQEWRMI